MSPIVLGVRACLLGLMLVAGCRDELQSPSGKGSGGAQIDAIGDASSGGATATDGAGIDVAGSGGQVGTGGTGAIGSGGTGPELCLLRATCTNGRITGEYGFACGTLDITCPSGCRTPPGAIPSYREDDVLIASRLAREALCEPADGGVLPTDAPPTDGSSTCLPNLVDGRDTGFDTCGDGTIHRRAALDCPSFAAGKCWKDAHCAAGSICVCGSALNIAGRCTAAGCLTERDCPTGQGCIATVRSQGGDTCAPAGTITFDCETPNDACSTNADCGDSPATPRECRLVGDKRVCGCRS